MAKPLIRGLFNHDEKHSNNDQAQKMFREYCGGCMIYESFVPKILIYTTESNWI